MARIFKWQQEIIDKWKNMSRRELFREIVTQAGGDDFYGGFTDRGLWEWGYLIDRFKERMGWKK